MASDPAEEKHVYATDLQSRLSALSTSPWQAAVLDSNDRQVSRSDNREEVPEKVWDDQSVSYENDADLRSVGLNDVVSSHTSWQTALPQDNPLLVDQPKSSSAHAALRESFDEFVTRREQFEAELQPRQIEVLSMSDQHLPESSFDDLPWVDLRPTTVVRLAEVDWLQNHLASMQSAMQAFLDIAGDSHTLASTYLPIQDSANVASANLDILTDLIDPAKLELLPEGISFQTDPGAMIDQIGRVVAHPSSSSDADRETSMPVQPFTPVQDKSTHERLKRAFAERSLVQEKVMDLFALHDEQAVNRSIKADRDEPLSETDQHFHQRLRRERKSLDQQLDRLNIKIAKLESKLDHKKRRRKKPDPPLHSANDLALRTRDATFSPPLHASSGSSSVASPQSGITSRHIATSAVAESGALTAQPLAACTQ